MFQFFAVCGEGEAALSTQQYVIGKERDGAEKPARLLYVTHAFYSEEWNSSLHTHTCAELFFITGGHGAFQVQQDRFPVAINDLVVINTSVPHAETSQNGSPMEYVVLGVEGLETLTDLGGLRPAAPAGGAGAGLRLPAPDHPGNPGAAAGL